MASSEMNTPAPRSRQAEVAVVGGGVIGIACAHYLHEAGYRVTVMDRGEIGQGCSHANCGLICPSDVLPLTEPGNFIKGVTSLFNPTATFKIKAQWRWSLYRWLLQFARRCTHAQMLRAGEQLHALLQSSVREYQGLFAQYALDAQWQQSGLLYVLQTQRGLQRFEHTEQLLAEQFGLQAQRLNGDDLQAFDPAFKPGLAGAFYYTQDSSLRPEQLMHGWRQWLESQGVGFKPHCALSGVSRANGAISHLETSRGVLSADHYVFALGAWSSQLAAELDCDIPVEPGKGYSLTMSRPEICPKQPMLFPEQGVGVTPFANGYRIASMMEFAGFNTQIPPWRIEQLKAAAQPFLRQPLGSDLVETWYGWRPMTWDSLPIIGRLPRLSNGLLATGHNMLGLSLAPVTGRLIAELVAEHKPHIDIDALSPTRF